jgi:hypothetical protein
MPTIENMKTDSILNLTNNSKYENTRIFKQMIESTKYPENKIPYSKFQIQMEDLTDDTIPEFPIK